MLSDHFYESDGRDFLGLFFKKATRLAVLVDPPFGVLVEPLQRTLSSLQALFRQQNRAGELLTVLFLPVFAEKRLPAFKMLDYKVSSRHYCAVHGHSPTIQVTYANHPAYKSAKKTPVRMFTDAADLKQFKLPTEQGYRLCRPCGRFVAAENQHCRQCNACTTKVS